ncbi:MAG: hypothetical protein GTN89_10060 [Acidobacteria bacterium]|nr:hypothetical protein [Acidobacteriota bacterium]NIM61227.1 hypothetical protein [Acidobacteriota bacterium]NIO59605.1 hypothetical protein [Acidobacteriota bacterium]NIQ30698.1 hypothetical protein [Acidobacteriota bacterium]NIQ85671.1 hypothetical protein [Acidobacteriota bacterium]
MSLPRKYDRRIRRVLGLRAVWQPGAVIDLGDVVTLRRGIFVPVEALSDFGVRFRRKRAKTAELTLNSQGVSETLFQAGREVDGAGDLEPNVKAALEIRFERDNAYYLRTPRLVSTAMDNVGAVGRAVARLPEWDFSRNYVVWKVLLAEQFTFIGSRRRNRTIEFSGSGKAVGRLLTSGLSTGVTRSSSRKLDLEIIGTGGPIAIGVTRVRRDGKLRDV